jgi:hypothetical protein
LSGAAETLPFQQIVEGRLRGQELYRGLCAYDLDDHRVTVNDFGEEWAADTRYPNLREDILEFNVILFPGVDYLVNPGWDALGLILQSRIAMALPQHNATDHGVTVIAPTNQQASRAKSIVREFIIGEPAGGAQLMNRGRDIFESPA